MLKFLLGVVVGIFIGALVIAPNPEFGERVDAVWDNARGWIGGVAEEAGDAAEDVAGGVREAGERAGEEVEELGEETR